MESGNITGPNSSKENLSPELVFDKSIKEEERIEIINEIERQVQASKSPIREDAFRLNPVKKGIGFPLVINIFAVLAVAASFVVSNRLYEQRQDQNTQQTQFFLSAEGKLLEELRKETTAKLQAKDNQIGQIQQELVELDRRSSELEANMEATISAREQALRQQMEAALEEERQRLAGTGTNQEEIQAKLVELQNQIESRNSQALETFRKESQAAVEAQRKELEKTIALNQSLLAQANAEKTRLADESRAREAEMSSRFQKEKAALEAQSQEALTALSSLTRIQESQYLLDDQVTGAYRSIINKIETEEFSVALMEISALRRLLASERVTAIPAYANRQTTDLFILDMLKEKVESMANRSDATSANLVEAADRLLTADDLANRGWAAYEAGNLSEASDYFIRSLDTIPSLARGHETLISMDTAAKERTVRAALQKADELAAAEDTAGALEQYLAVVRAGAAVNPQWPALAMENALALKEREYSRLAAENAAKAAALESSLNQRITAVTQEKNLAVAALEREKTRLAADLTAEKETALKALEDEKNREISRLRILLSDEQALVSRQETELAEARQVLTDSVAMTESETADALEKQNREALALAETRAAQEKEALIREYEDKITGLEAEYAKKTKAAETAGADALEELKKENQEAAAALEAKLAEKESELKALQDQYAAASAAGDSSGQAAEEIAGLKARLEPWETLESGYVSLKTRVERLMNTGVPADFFRAESLLTDFLNREAVDLLPGLTDFFAATTKARSDEAAEKALDEGLTRGRTQALEDVLLFTQYLTQDDISGQNQILNRITQKAAEDLRYAKTIQEIETLAKEGSEKAALASIPIGQPQLLGTVARVSGSRILIEPLAEMSLNSGMTISVRRKSRRNEEILLTTGSIISTAGGQIEGEILTGGSAGNVEISDLVYVIVN